MLGAGPAGSGGGGGTGTAAGPTGAAREEGERASEGAQQAGSNRPERAMTEWDLGEGLRDSVDIRTTNSTNSQQYFKQCKVSCISVHPLATPIFILFYFFKSHL